MLEAAVILAAGVPAVVTDHRSRRIPNALVLATLAAGLGVGLWTGGLQGLAGAVGGAAVGLACLLPFYLAGALGAGDVKFMAALGSVLGPGDAFLASAAALVAGAVLGIAFVGWRRFAELPAAPDAAAIPDSPARALGRQMPYAAAIVAGALLVALDGIPGN